ncbi:MAG TPA: hypothetical protein VKZ63_07960 [Kofleriaceae bacterium]|nr:hypothetical protein [Kofleriaceae bacterium]
MKHEVRIPVLSVFRVVLCVAALAACGGDDDSGDGGGGGGGTPGQDAGPRPDADVDRVLSFPADRVGWIYLVEGFAGFDGVSAALFDAPDVPEPALVAAEGDCEVWARPDAPALCDPPCQGGYCVADNQCVPLPQPVTAGTITVDGLTGPLQFVESGPYYQPDPAIPPEDLFADDATITATAPGGDLDGFSLEAGGVAPLEAQLDLEYDVTLVIEDEVDEVIRWTPESSGEIQLALLTGHHGSPYRSLLVCETADDGELTIPGSLITQFPRDDSGHEQHFSWIARFTRDLADTPAGPIELWIASRILIPQLEHRGP